MKISLPDNIAPTHFENNEGQLEQDPSEGLILYGFEDESGTVYDVDGSVIGEIIMVEDSDLIALFVKQDS